MGWVGLRNIVMRISGRREEWIERENLRVDTQEEGCLFHQLSTILFMNL